MSDNPADWPESCKPSHIFKWLFLPDGYPKSVAPEYFDYQLWDTIQQVIWFVMSIIGNQAMYAFFGVGGRHASMAFAILLQFSRDLLSSYMSLGVSFPAAVALYQSRPGFFRMCGEVLNVAGIMSEILACEYRSIFLMWMAPLLWCVSSSMTGVARSCILQHFAMRQNNKEVVVKENNQDKGGRIVGLLGGAAVLQLIGMGSGDTAREDHEVWASLIVASVLAIIHLCSNYLAVRALQCPPSCFSLRNSSSQHFAALQSGRIVEEASDEKAEVFKVATAGGIMGKVLGTSDGKFIDQDGQLHEDPIKADLEFKGRGGLMEANWGTKGEKENQNEKAVWEIIPKRSLAKGNSCDVQSAFFPPGFPRTTPPKYEEHCAYSIMQRVTATPIHFIDMWITWRYVFGIGDTSKSPEYASYISCYLSGIFVIAGLVCGLPNFANTYGSGSYFASHFVGDFVGGFVGIISSLSPLKVFLLLRAFSESVKAWSGVVHGAISAQADMMWARHPAVDLAHITTSRGNRGSLMSGLTGALCLWFAFHLQRAGAEAEPPIPTMLAMYSLMQAVNLYSAYKIYLIYSDLLSPDVSHGDYKQISQSGPCKEDAKELQPLLETKEPSSSALETEQAEYSGASHRSKKRLSLSKVLSVLPTVLIEIGVYGALVGTLSDVKLKLRPCSSSCMQFKLMSDGSFISNTGIWPFELHNGLSQSEIQDVCLRWGGNFCDALPGASCKEIANSTCMSDATLENVQNPLKEAKSKYIFLFSLVAYSILILLHDSGLQSECLGPARAIILQVLATYTLALMTGAALMWSSGVMQLFFSKVSGSDDCMGTGKCAADTCGCYFEMGDISAMLALAVPSSLIFRLRTKTICTMRSAIVGSSYLSTATYHLPHNFMPPDEVDTWSALGPGGFGYPQYRAFLPVMENSARMRLAKNMARWICVICPVIILPPLLLASCSLIYRGVALLLLAMKQLPWVDDYGDVADSMGMCGFYGMIFLQFAVLYLFIPNTWRLFYILSIQLGKCDADLEHVIKPIKIEHPELAWALDRRAVMKE